MPQADRNFRCSPGDQRKASSFKTGGGRDSERYVEVNAGVGSGYRKPNESSSKSGRVLSEEAFMDSSPETLSTTAAVPVGPPRLLATLFPRSSWAAQALQYTLSEGGMALMTAFILFLISCAGFVTMYFVAPPRTTGVYTKLRDMFTSNVEESQLVSLNNVMPEVVTLLQAGVRFMLVPSLMVSIGGIFILSNAERRRPGCWLMTYGCCAVVLGLAVLYLLLRVMFGGGLHGLEENVNESLFELWSAMDREMAPCHWEKVFPCSGFHWCCVTNTTELTDDSEWDSLCFLTLPSGTAVTRAGANVTELVVAQCGVLRVPEDPQNAEVLMRSTACALSSTDTSEATNTARLSTCENYLLGHLTSTVGFSLCLVLGMTVCSLVSGAVALISNLQRTRSSDFMLVSNPAVAMAMGESAMTTKGEKAASLCSRN
jgi:hypothetical protein